MASPSIVEPPAGTEAHAAYEKAVKGDIAAVKELAYAYHFGRLGITENYAVAFGLYQLAVAAGDTEAMVSLAGMYKAGYPGVAQDFAEARHLYERAAENGCVRAQLEVGWLYSVRRPIDLAKSRHYYRSAAEGGHPHAMFQLAYLLDRGMGGPADCEAAAHWYLRAALAGHPHAQRTFFSEYVSRWNNETRMAVQRRLRDEGHYSGRIDGHFGEKTHAALRALIGPLKPVIDEATLRVLARLNAEGMAHNNR